MDKDLILVYLCYKTYFLQLIKTSNIQFYFFFLLPGPTAIQICVKKMNKLSFPKELMHEQHF